jgi:alcohol dehydrogenase class IV
MDAIAQLLEAYLSTGATPITDALALEGLRAAGESYAGAVKRGDTDIDARSGMAYAAYLSGICLANAGLGVVHGLAGPAGAFTGIPHGVFCGNLLGPAVRMLAERVSNRADAAVVLGKLSAAGRTLTGRSASSVEDGVSMLHDQLSGFARIGRLEGLGSYGFTDEVLERVAAEGGNKACPVQFGQSERLELLRRCL